MKAGFTQKNLEDLVGKKKVKETLVIRAPCSGTILGTLPHVGERLTSDKIMFHIVNLDRVWFVGKVFEQDLGALKIGQQIQVQTKASAKIYPAKLVYIDRMLDPQTRTVQARFEIENKSHQLLPGLSGSGSMTTAVGGEVIAVSSSAVMDTGKRKMVYVRVSPNTYEQREIKTGVEGSTSNHPGDRVEVLSGLEEGDEVVVSGSFLIDAESQLRGGN